jgi:hypothetical protein
MPSNKTENLNMRVRPQTKRALQAIAKLEKRSMANAIECLVDEYLTRNHINVPVIGTERTRQPVTAHGGVS